MNKNIIGIAGILTLLIPGYAYVSTSTKSLTPTKSDIVISAHELTEKETVALLGSTARRFFTWKRHKIQPIKLSIHNRTNKAFELSPSDLNVFTIPVKKIKQRLRKSMAIPALTFIGGYTATLLATLPWAAQGVAACYLPDGGKRIRAIRSAQCWLALPISIFGATTATGIAITVKYKKINKKMQNALDELSLKEGIIIKPYETVDKLIFVRKNNLETYFFAMLDRQNQLQQLIIRFA